MNNVLQVAVTRLSHAEGLALPAYKQIGREGTEHEPVFLVEVTVGKLPPAQGRRNHKDRRAHGLQLKLAAQRVQVWVPAEIQVRARPQGHWLLWPRAGSGPSL